MDRLVHLWEQVRQDRPIEVQELKQCYLDFHEQADFWRKEVNTLKATVKTLQ